MCEYCKAEYERGYNDAMLEIQSKEQGLTIIAKTDKEKLEDKLIEFIQFRKETKRPMKKASEKAFTRKLEKLSGGDPLIAIEILEESIAQGWQGIFPLKNEPKTEVKKVSKINITY